MLAPANAADALAVTPVETVPAAEVVAVSQDGGQQSAADPTVSVPADGESAGLTDVDSSADTTDGSTSAGDDAERGDNVIDGAVSEDQEPGSADTSSEDRDVLLGQDRTQTVTPQDQVTQGGITYMYTGSAGGGATVTDYDKSYGLDVVIPREIVVEGKAYQVTKIGEKAFYFKRLTSVVIPDTVQFIQNFAFQFNKLQWIDIPGSVRTIHHGAFGHNDLEGVNLSEGVQIIDDFAFDTNPITEIWLPSSTSRIGEKAFRTDSLEHVWLTAGADGAASIPQIVERGNNASFGSTQADPLIHFAPGRIWVTEPRWQGYRTVIGEPGTHQVVFDGTGGTGAPAAVTATHGTLLSEPSQQPSRAGYTFTGWYTDQTATKQYRWGRQLTGDLTLYAGWQADTYTVLFDGNAAGDASITNLPDAVSVEYGKSASEPAQKPSRTGYTFTGWYTKSAAGKLAAYRWDTPMTGHLRLFAGWRKINDTGVYRVRFDANTGDTGDGNGVAGLPKPVTVNHGQSVSPPTTAPVRAGYSFTGWLIQARNGSLVKYRFDTPVTSDLKLVAGWKAGRYRVTFDSAGGSRVQQVTVLHGSKVREPARKPVRPGHTFNGWRVKDQTSGQVQNEVYDWGTPVTGDLVLVAAWSLKQVTVSFDANTGSGSAGSAGNGDNADNTDAGGSAVAGMPEPARIGVSEAVIAPATSPIRAGYRFTGWKTFTRSGKLVNYRFATPVTGDLILVAGWKPVRYRVTFDSAGGSRVQPVTITHGGTVSQQVRNPVRPGHTFAGWQTVDPVTGVRTEYHWDTPVTGDLKLVAAWQRQTIEVVFQSGVTAGDTVNYGNTVGAALDSTGDVSAGVVGMPTKASVARGGRVSEPVSVPSRDGYRFTGWYTTSRSGKLVRYRFNKPVTEKLVLTAGWQAAG